MKATPRNLKKSSSIIQKVENISLLPKSAPEVKTLHPRNMDNYQKTDDKRNGANTNELIDESFFQKLE